MEGLRVLRAACRLIHDRTVAVVKRGCSGVVLMGGCRQVRGSTQQTDGVITLHEDETACTPPETTAKRDLSLYLDRS